MLNTPYFGWTYPEDNDDPYFDIIEGFFQQQDDSTFGLMNTACNIIIPPSTISWNPLFRQLTWNADFTVPLMSVGFLLKVRYGPDGLNRVATFNDGQRLIITVPRTATGELVANFSIVSGAVPITNGVYTVGMCVGTNFYANFPQVYT